MTELPSTLGHRPRAHPDTPEEPLTELLSWTARVGAVTAEALARLDCTSIPSARARLGGATRRGLLVRHRLLVDRASLYTVTRAGLRVAGWAGLDPVRISASNFAHTLACAHVAVALRKRYPGHLVTGEHELRRQERVSGGPVASAVLVHAGAARPLLHRPDLVLQAAGSPMSPPIAVEVELTLKSPHRLAQICRAWARSRAVAGVIYLAPPHVERALERAIATAQAGERVLVVPLAALALDPKGGADRAIHPKRDVASSRCPPTTSNGDATCPTQRSTA
jgi:hypothetical protein